MISFSRCFLMNLVYICFVLTILAVPTIQSDEDKIDISKIAQFTTEYTYDVYAGYLNITYLDKAFYYMLYKSQSGKDSDPIILWLAGAVGCSSLMSMVTENGPLIFPPQNSSTVINQNAWNLNAHLLYIESPAGVGFSKGKRESMAANDTSLAQDNYVALLKFFEKFPELKSKDFYIAGENYAGIYAPRLATQIISNNQQQSAQDRKINIKGILLGNACTHPTQCYSANFISRYQAEFMYTRGFIDGATYSQYQSTCIASDNQRSTNCEKIQQKIQTNFYNSKANIYNVYGTCYPLPAGTSQFDKYMLKMVENQLTGNQNLKRSLKCSDVIGANILFSKEQNREFLHVESNQTLKWLPCVDSPSYTVESRAAYTYLPSLVRYGLQVFYYSGDFDAMVPIQGTIQWLKKYRSDYGASVKKNWRPWSLDKKAYSGMLWQLDGITFWSVAGAGSMVAFDKPQEAKLILDIFLGQKNIGDVQLLMQDLKQI